MACTQCEAKRRAMRDSWKKWWSQPFSTDMDVPHWFLFFGLILVISFGWATSINSLRKVTA